MQELSRSLWMLLQASLRELRNLLLMNIVTGAGPSVSLLLSKVAINATARLLGQGTTTGGLGRGDREYTMVTR